MDPESTMVADGTTDSALANGGLTVESVVVVEGNGVASGETLDNNSGSQNESSALDADEQPKEAAEVLL